MSTDLLLDATIPTSVCLNQFVSILLAAWRMVGIQRLEVPCPKGRLLPSLVSIWVSPQCRRSPNSSMSLDLCCSENKHQPTFATFGQFWVAKPSKKPRIAKGHLLKASWLELFFKKVPVCAFQVLGRDVWGAQRQGSGFTQ